MGRGDIAYFERQFWYLETPKLQLFRFRCFKINLAWVAHIHAMRFVHSNYAKPNKGPVVLHTGPLLLALARAMADGLLRN